MPNPVVRFVIGSSDRTKAAQFYARMFDWQMEDAGVSHRVDTGGKLRGNIIDGGQGFALFYVSVEDIHEALKKAQELGGEVVAPPEQKSNGLYAVFADPEGTWIGLFQRTEKAQS